MVPVLQLMALKGMIWALAAATGASIYFAFGRPDINVKINLVQLAILGLFIYPLALRYGIVGVAVLSVISIMASYILNVGISARFTGVTLRAYLAVLTGPFLGAAASAAVAYVFYAVMPWQGVSSFLLSILLMTALYAAWLILSGRYRLATKLWSIIRSGNDKLRN
jgi:O-antigen/teichoic acid export membrane protein